MKIDEDSLLLLHDAGSLTEEEFLLLYDINSALLELPIIRLWKLRKWRMCFGISIWKERCLYFGWNIKNSRDTYFLQ